MVGPIVGAVLDFTGLNGIINFIKLIIDNVTDLIYGLIALSWHLGKTAVELIPIFWDIILDIFDILDYLIDLVLEYWRIPVVIVMLIPCYFLTFVLITRINSFLG